MIQLRMAVVEEEMREINKQRKKKEQAVSHA